MPHLTGDDKLSMKELNLRVFFFNFNIICGCPTSRIIVSIKTIRLSCIPNVF